MISAVVLAGGASQRMGRPKALLTIDGESFIARILRIVRASGVPDVVVVTGAHHDLIAAHLGATERIVRNPVAGSDQLTSLRLGLSSLAGDARVTGVVVALVDHPLIDAATLEDMRDVFAASAAPVVRPVCEGRHGHPVIFGRETFEMLLHANLPDGAKGVLRAFGGREVLVATTNAGVLVDVDTPDDYRRLEGAATGENDPATGQQRSSDSR